MFLKKLFKFLGFLCITFAFLVLFLFIYGKYKDREKHSFIIKENQNRNTFYTNVLYLEIPSLSIKRIVKKSSTKKNLDDGYVVVWNKEKDIEKIGNLLLAGHNIQNVFKNLSKIKMGEKVYLYYKNDVFIYEVISKKIISVTESAYLEDLPYKQLSLITCMKDNQKRLFIICSFIEKKSF